MNDRRAVTNVLISDYSFIIGEICNTDNKRLKWVMQFTLKILKSDVSPPPLFPRLSQLTQFVCCFNGCSTLFACQCFVSGNLGGINMISQKYVKWPWSLNTVWHCGGMKWVKITCQHYNQVEWTMGRITQAETKTDVLHQNGNFKREHTGCGIIVAEVNTSTSTSDNISFYESVR